MFHSLFLWKFFEIHTHIHTHTHTAYEIVKQRNEHRYVNICKLSQYIFISKHTHTHFSYINVQQPCESMSSSYYHHCIILWIIIIIQLISIYSHRVVRRQHFFLLLLLCLVPISCISVMQNEKDINKNRHYMSSSHAIENDMKGIFLRVCVCMCKKIDRANFIKSRFVRVLRGMNVCNTSH